MLDELPRARKRPAAEELLGDPAEFLGACTKAVSADLAGASAGAWPLRVICTTARSTTRRSSSTLSPRRSRTIVEPLRARLERALGEGAVEDDDDPSGDPVDELELADRIRACYREWRGPRLTVAVTDVWAPAPSGRSACRPPRSGRASLVDTDRGDKPCPDCDDNGLAGVVAAGEQFPTGQFVPPAHPGCRCLASHPWMRCLPSGDPARVALDPARGVMSVSR